MSGITLVEIDWEGPLSLPELKTRVDVHGRRGLYQIYGPHNVYGRDALLYIGKSTADIVNRVIAHNWESYERASEIRVHVGRIVEPNVTDPGALDSLVLLVERLLVYAHGPAYNSNLIKDPAPSDPIKDIHVLNWHNHGALMPELSGRRWTTAPPRRRQLTGAKA